MIMACGRPLCTCETRVRARIFSPSGLVSSLLLSSNNQCRQHCVTVLGHPCDSSDFTTKMSSYSREGRVRRSRSLSRSRRSRSRSRSRSLDAENPGNNLYVTGLSTRVTNADLEKFFGGEGKVTECHLVTDPRTRESRGFAFVTMETVEDADRCIKYLNRSVLEGRLITVEKAKRSRGRTPTPGRYHGLREKQRGTGRRRSRSYSPYRYNRDSYSRDRRGRSRSPYGRGRSRSPYGRRDHYSDSFRRRRERSLSAGSSGYRR